MAQKIYRTMQGKVIEIDKLIARHETTLAVGNAKMNARGDQLGPGGQIIKKNETDAQEYHIPTNAVPPSKKDSAE